MKVLLLGAMGRIGKLVLKSALGEGHELNCLGRNLEKSNLNFTIGGKTVTHFLLDCLKRVDLAQKSRLYRNSEIQHLKSNIY